MKVLFWLTKALQGLKLLFDPALEGNPYERKLLVNQRREKRQGTPRFGLRRRVAFRYR